MPKANKKRSSQYKYIEVVRVGVPPELGPLMVSAGAAVADDPVAGEPTTYYSSTEFWLRDRSVWALVNDQRFTGACGIVRQGIRIIQEVEGQLDEPGDCDYLKLLAEDHGLLMQCATAPSYHKNTTPPTAHACRLRLEAIVQPLEDATDEPPDSDETEDQPAEPSNGKHPETVA